MKKKYLSLCFLLFMVMALCPYKAKASLPTNATPAYNSADGLIYVSGSSRYKTYAKKAMNNWNSAKKVFVWTDNTRMADLLIRDTNASGTTKKGYKLGVYDGRYITFYHVRMKKVSSKEKVYVAMHELGHALGLGHPSGSTRTIMASGKKRPSNQKPSSTDKAAVKKVYNKVMNRLKSDYAEEIAIRDSKKTVILPCGRSVAMARVMHIKSITSNNPSVAFPYKHAQTGMYKGFKTSSVPGKALITINTGVKTYKYNIVVVDTKAKVHYVTKGQTITIPFDGIDTKSLTMVGVPVDVQYTLNGKKQSIHSPAGKAQIINRSADSMTIKGIDKGELEIRYGSIKLCSLIVR